MKFNLLSTFVALVFVIPQACSGSHSEKGKHEINKSKSYTEEQLEEQGLSTAYFASGCFWCVEAIFQSVKGVKEAVSGYSGGEIAEPSYEQVSRDQTKHAEAIKVIYDPEQVSFEVLLKVFFGSHDPTTLNQQGPDRGAQYRSIAFYQNEKEKQLIEAHIQKLEAQKIYESPIVTQIVKFEKFWEAEDYHQEYEQKHPENPYVQSVSIPRLNRFKKKFPELLKENH
jgi:peptide-methionine (S)-S-oxide reductase